MLFFWMVGFTFMSSHKLPYLTTQLPGTIAACLLQHGLLLSQAEYFQAGVPLPYCQLVNAAIRWFSTGRRSVIDLLASIPKSRERSQSEQDNKWQIRSKTRKSSSIPLYLVNMISCFISVPPGRVHTRPLAPGPGRRNPLSHSQTTWAHTLRAVDLVPNTYNLYIINRARRSPLQSNRHRNLQVSIP